MKATKSITILQLEATDSMDTLISSISDFFFDLASIISIFVQSVLACCVFFEINSAHNKFYSEE
jgi:hypothetical protein